MTEQIILEWIEETCAAYCIPRPFAIVEELQAARATPADHSEDKGYWIQGGRKHYVGPAIKPADQAAFDRGLKAGNEQAIAQQQCIQRLQDKIDSLCATPADQEPIAWQYENAHGNPFLTHKDPSTWHPHDRAGFKNFVALYAAPQNAADHIVDANKKVDAPTLNKLMWSDMSTASPIEKARRVLDHLAKQDSAYFFEDGFPRSVMMSDVRACIAVLNYLAPQPEAQSVRDAVELTPSQISDGWKQTFSTNNPFCPCDLRTFTKAVRWAERSLKSAPPQKPVSDGVKP